jgi:hypothetical protein
MSQSESLQAKWEWLAKEFNAHSEEERKGIIDKMMTHPTMKDAVVALGNLASICLDGAEIHPKTLCFLEIMGFRFQKVMMPRRNIDA